MNLEVEKNRSRVVASKEKKYFAELVQRIKSQEAVEHSKYVPRKSAEERLKDNVGFGDVLLHKNKPQNLLIKEAIQGAGPNGGVYSVSIPSQMYEKVVVPKQKKRVAMDNLDRRISPRVVLELGGSLQSDSREPVAHHSSLRQSRDTSPRNSHEGGQLSYHLPRVVTNPKLKRVYTHLKSHSTVDLTNKREVGRGNSQSRDEVDEMGKEEFVLPREPGQVCCASI